MFFPSSPSFSASSSPLFQCLPACRQPAQFSPEEDAVDSSRKRGRSDAVEPITPPDVNGTCSVDVSIASAPEQSARTIKQIRTRARDKAFTCTVHGKIELHPTLLKIIDTPQFQRLRRCKQLGHAGYVFQNATHSRFEHSIGVAYKAGKLVKRFMEKQPGLNVTTKDKLCVEIAALVHDLGHGPFSHQFEHVLHAYGKQMHQEAEACEDDLQRAKMLQQAEIMKKWCHEDQSIKMLDYLLQVNNIGTQFTCFTCTNVQILTPEELQI